MASGEVPFCEVSRLALLPGFVSWAVVVSQKGCRGPQKSSFGFLFEADRGAFEENMRDVPQELRDLIQVSEAAARMERSEGRR
jgi:hypothetical protein